MANIKSADRIVAKWEQRASVSGQAYSDGIDNPKADWATQTKAAEANYEKGVQAAMSAKRFGKGVARAGTAAWQKGAKEKGTLRWAQGISTAKDAYMKGFEPYRAVIAGLNLPPRGPKGDAANYARVAAVGNALHAKKLTISGS
jgi:hypothetical protein